MLEDQVAYLLQKYLGNYVRGLNKEALKISVWKGDVELTNMQLRPEALNALKLPVKVKAGFLGSVKLKVPWSRLGQEPVLVYLDRILLLAEPATQVEGRSEDAVQEAKKIRVREMEMKLLEHQQQLRSEMNTSWLGSLISTIIGNIKLSITNIHIRYEDTESNPGHPFAAGLTLARLSAVTVDDFGEETFATGGALERIQKSVELERLAIYFDSNICSWNIDKPWEELLPPEWSQIFELVNKDGKWVNMLNALSKEHNYILQPVTGNAKYTKLRPNESRKTGQALQKATVLLDDVTLSLAKDGYRDILKMADNFAAFNQRLKYAHYRPPVPVKADPISWWKYAYKVVTDEMKKASGKLSWEQVLRYARLRKRYISLYASLLNSDTGRLVVDDNKEVEKLDRELDIEVILQWRMLAHKFLEQSAESDLYQGKQKAKQPWWSFGWSGSSKDGGEPQGFTEEDWERLNKIIGYKEGSDEQLLGAEDEDLMHLYLEICMKHNASKLVSEGQECLADLSCEGLACNIKTYSEAKIFELKLGSYKLSSPYGLLAESATVADSLVGVFSYKPFDAQVDWSFVARASPCYMTYLKESIDQVIAFFKSSPTVSQTLALETAAAVQMTIDGVKRTAQQQVTQVIKDQSRFLLHLDIAAPKITIPTKFCPDDIHATRLLLDLGNLMLRTEDYWGCDSSEEKDMYLQFNLVLSDVSAFLVDGDYCWSETPIDMDINQQNNINFLPVIEKCGIVLKLEQIQLENPFYPSTRLAVRLPSLGFHFSPARYHRLMQVLKIFREEDGMIPDVTFPWNQADFEGWLSVLTWKGMGNREAVWQRRYCCLVGPYLYILENPISKTYKQYHSLRGKQVHQVPTEFTGGVENLLALYDAGQSNPKVVEDINALIVRCDNDEIRKIWQNRFQGAIYRASGSAAMTSLSETSSLRGIKAKSFDNTDAMNIEKLFVTGVLDELRICFSCNSQNNQSFKKILLGQESRLFEFRAIGGQVELSVRASTIFIGTLLKSLEIEDQFFCGGTAVPRFVARSFINITEDATLHSSTSFTDVIGQNVSNSPLNHTDSEDKFFEASDDLDDLADHPVQRQGSTSEYFSAKCSFPSPKPSIKPPSFSRIPGLIPDAELQSRSLSLEMTDTLDSFVKAQIVIYDQASPQYNNIDNRVMVTLATLSFFCHRPTILAILGFVNAVNAMEEYGDAGELISKSRAMINTYENASVDEPTSAIIQEPVAKGLFGKGKTRVIFYLTLNMARAQIFLMHENGASFATLSQNNLLTDIKVFPSSFCIKAALGNLKISDNSLPSSHSYFWICDMRNPGGSSFVELDFSSFSIDDEDYCGYDYSLIGQLSEVRIVYLNRFVQEVANYFMGLVPSNVESVVKLKDQVTSSEKWVTKTEIEGSPALRLDLSLSRPVILMPRRTDSMDYLELDVLQITVQNEFQWIGGDKNEINCVHLEILTIKVKDINLTVGTGAIVGESIIQDVKGLSVVIQRSLRDLLHQIPTIEAAVKIEVLKAALSNREYEITTECALSNFSETPHVIPALDKGSGMSIGDVMVPETPVEPGTIDSESQERQTWMTMKILVAIDLMELSLHSGITRDSSLASVKAIGAWLLYKSNTLEEGFLFATLKGFSVIDEREGTKEELRLAIGKSGTIGDTSLHHDGDDTESLIDSAERKIQKEHGVEPIPSMLIFDATFRKSSTNISLCIQKPKLLVALDFLLAMVEFFVPSVQSLLSNDEDNDPLHVTDAIVLDHPMYTQPDSVFSLSPRKPLIVDDERFDHFIYDGKGGKLYLQDKEGKNISSPCSETIIFVGSGKSLQFRNVTIMNGEYLDSCVFLGTDSSYSVSKDDYVFLERGNICSPLNSLEERSDGFVIAKAASDGSTEFVIELQAIGPELTFHNTSKDVGESLALSTKVMHANLDVFCRLVMKGDSFEMSGNVLGLKVESKGIMVLEPFDTCVKFSNASGKTHMHLAVSDIFMNFSFSILSLFLAVEEDILTFLRMSSKKVSVICSQFDRVGTVQNHKKDQTYAFWRPRAPSGFAVLGDCLTPLNEPPSKGVIAVNTSFVRVKRPVSYKLIWQCSLQSADKGHRNWISISTNDSGERYNTCSVWFPVAPKGYVAVGCVVSAGSTQPPLSAAFCISSSFVSPCALKDCIALSLSDLNSANIAFWRVENSFGSFLPADPKDMSLIDKPRDLRHLIFGHSELPTRTTKSSVLQDNRISDNHAQLERSALLTSGRLFQAVATFKLIWWNQGTTSRKKLSIWRPVVPHGMVYLGDLAVQGYEPPNSAIVLHDTGDDTFLKSPQDFQLVGHIKKHRGVESVSFWLPQAPPGFVALGCIASKGSLKHDDLSSLRCIRSDMVTGDQFAEESIWDTSESKVMSHFSLWSVGNELGTFLVRSGFRKPPKRFALKLAGPTVSSGSDNTVIDAEIKTFSTAIFDDYGGLMVPLFNMSFENIAFSLHGRPDYLNSTMSFSLSARSFNDKHESWEPLIEPSDGFLRYQYDINAPGAATQLRMTSTRDLNLNVSVSNANMMFQAYSSWNNLSHIDESSEKREAVSPTHDERSIINIHHRKNYYIIPQNKLGQDIYMRLTEFRRISDIIKMPSGDKKPVKVPVSKNMLDSHLKGKPGTISRSMVTIVIADAELTIAEGMTTGQYMMAVRLFLNPPTESPLQQQSARTCGAISEISSFGIATATWNEMFFFRVDFVDNFVVEFVLIDLGRGDPVGMYSAPLKQIAYELPPSSNSYDSNYELSWKELSSAKTSGYQNDACDKSHGRIRYAVLLSVRPELKNDKQDHATGSKTGFIQISPTREGPWTTVRLNYAAPAACWRLGNDVVASEATVRDGNRYVNIRSLVSVTNNTDFVIHLRLIPRCSFENQMSLDSENENGDGRSSNSSTEMDEFFETEKYVSSVGWISCSPCLPIFNQSDQCPREGGHQGASIVELPDGWEWTDDWHVDVTSVRTADGWVYASDAEHLKWPESSDHINSVNYARQRKWIRHRRRIVCDGDDQISVGILKPGDNMPLPLSGMAHPMISYVLQLKPKCSSDRREYSWSVVLKKHGRTEISERQEESPEICVSALTESDYLLFCSQIDGTSSETSQGLWFFLSTQAKEIGKDINSDPIHDWNLIINSPISLVNYLPLSAEYSVSANQSSEENNTCSRGTLAPSETVKIYNADLRDPLYLSLLPEGGWQPVHEPVPISHPSRMPSKMINLRSSLSGRIVPIILEQNYDQDRLTARVLRIYVPYWISIARSPPLVFAVVDISGRREKRHISVPFHSNTRTEKILWQISEEEMVGGYTIASALNFKLLGFSASISKPGNERFGPVKDLSPLGDMDGSVELSAYDTDGNCMRLLVSSKPSPYQAVPTKVISICPYMTFTNMLGEDIYIKFGVEDQHKVLHKTDSRVSFVYFEAGGPDKLQIQLEDTDWCFPVEIVKEDTIIIVLKKHNGGRRFLRAEVRGYEEGSRFLVVFRLASTDGPIRIENRTLGMIINVRQSGLDEDASIHLKPLSTTKFSWDDPYGQRLLDIGFHNGIGTYIQNVNLEKTADICAYLRAQGIQIHVMELGDVKIVRFTDDRSSQLGSHEEHDLSAVDDNWGTLHPQTSTPLELIIELGVVGVSLIDHRPREFLYLYLEKVFVSYSTGYDAGTTSRFKLIIGQLQLDNQLPLTLMPVLLAPEGMPDMNHPLFKATITMNNENADGIQVYPYIFIRVTDRCWRLNIHEPIIWALVDFYNNLRIDNIPSSSSVTHVDPEIRIELIDISEIRLKLSLETAPTLRPHGVLGMWSPVLSAVGNAFKIQVHLRKVMHGSRFVRKSSIIPAIVNRIKRDLIHNPLHLIFSVDVFGMTKSTLASLSKGFAELSTDGQFLQLRSKQVWSRKITGVGDGILQGTEALAQGVAFGVSGVLRKPVESARQYGFLGLAHGLGRAFLGFVVQPLSGALDFVSLTVDGIGASCARCLEILNNRSITQRIRNPRAILANGVFKEYNETAAVGQMVLYLAEASGHLGCTDLFKEPSKFAWSDYYEDHFIVPYQRIVLITNKRVMLLQCLALDKMDKKPSKILWDVPWEELLALELAKAGYQKPSHVIIHLKNFRRSENFIRLIKCNVEEDEMQEPQAVVICSSIRKMWKAHQADAKILVLKVPSSQRHVQFAWDETDGRDSHSRLKPLIKQRGNSISDERRFVRHGVNFQKIWSSEQEYKSRCTLFPKQVADDGTICSIWRPLCPDGYISVGDIAHVGTHPPHVAAIYQASDQNFALPLGYDLVWRNCAEDYSAPLSIWLPRPPDGYVAVGCVALAAYEEPVLDSAYCVYEGIAEDALFEEQMVWSAPDSYPWSCYVYQVQSEALQFISLRQRKEESEWRPMRVSDRQPLQTSEAQSGER